MNDHIYYLRKIIDESLYAEWLDQLQSNADSRMTPSYARIFRYFKYHKKYYGNSNVLRNLQRLLLVRRVKHHYKKYYILTKRGHYLYQDGVFSHVKYWHINPKAPRTVPKRRARWETAYRNRSPLMRIGFSFLMLIVIAGILKLLGLSSPGILVAWLIFMATAFEDIDSNHDNILMYSSYMKRVHYIVYVNNVPHLKMMLDRDIGSQISEASFLSHLISFTYFMKIHNLKKKNPYCSFSRWSDYYHRWSKHYYHRTGSITKMFNMSAK